MRTSPLSRLVPCFQKNIEDRCAAGFLSGLCRLWVISVRDDGRNSTSHVRFASKKRTNSGCLRYVRFLPQADIRSAAKTAPLFDDLVGAGEQAIRHLKAECFGGFEIDDQLEFGRRLNW